MSDWNFAPHAPAREAMRRRLLGRAVVLMFCVVSGAGVVVLGAHWTQRGVENLQLQWQATQAQELKLSPAIN